MSDCWPRTSSRSPCNHPKGQGIQVPSPRLDSKVQNAPKTCKAFHSLLGGKIRLKKPCTHLEKNCSEQGYL